MKVVMAIVILDDEHGEPLPRMTCCGCTEYLEGLGLRHGLPLCRFSGFPIDWPPGHRWVGEDKAVRCDLFGLQGARQWVKASGVRCGATNTNASSRATRWKSARLSTP